MSSRFKIRGNWHHGLTDQFVDIKALDIFLRILPWVLAIEAIIRGWEFMRIMGFFPNIFSNFPLQGQAGEIRLDFEMFGLTFFLAGVLMIIGLLLRRFGIIISACLLGAASYSILSAGFFIEAFFGSSGTGARGGITFLILMGLWVFKGLFSASKRPVSGIEGEVGIHPDGVPR